MSRWALALALGLALSCPLRAALAADEEPVPSYRVAEDEEPPPDDSVDSAPIAPPEPAPLPEEEPPVDGMPQDYSAPE
jgi:hypothetical protein